jgi:hypothetical protein
MATVSDSAPPACPQSLQHQQQQLQAGDMDGEWLAFIQQQVHAALSPSLGLLLCMPATKPTVGHLRDATSLMLTRCMQACSRQVLATYS